MKDSSLLSLFHNLSHDPQNNIDTIVSHGVELLGSSSGFYQILDEHENMLHVQGVSGIPEGCKRRFEPQGSISYESVLCGNGKPVAFENLCSTPFHTSDERICGYDFKAYLGAPVFYGEKVRGSLDFFYCVEKKITADEMAVSSALARALSLEEERKTTLQSLNGRLAIGQMLYGISSWAASSEKTWNILDKSASLIGRTLDVGGVFFWAHSPEKHSLINVAEWLAPGIPSRKKEFPEFPVNAFPWGMELMSKGDILEFENTEEIPEGREKEIMRSMGIGAVLMIPFFVEERFAGTLGVEVYGKKRKWEKEEIDILSAVSGIFGKSIEHDRIEKTFKKVREELEERLNQRNSEFQAALDRLEDDRQKLVKSETMLKKLNKELLETNTAIKALARNVKREREASEKRLALELNSRIIPIISEIRACSDLEEKRLELDMLTGYLHEITASLTVSASSIKRLSSAEMRVASLISNGLTGSQIASRLNISPYTVKSHRKNIRRKLHITDAGINLKDHLNSLFGSAGPLRNPFP